MNFRTIEKTDKLGYIFTVFYNGMYFDSFDEIKNKITVKGEFKRVMNELGFTWAKGIQQGGRTDAKVSAERNLLYVSSNFSGSLQDVIYKFNEKMKPHLFIRKVQKTFPNLSFPDYVEKREYIYTYPKKKIISSLEDIDKYIAELSGTYDVSIFTDKKGLSLKNHERSVEISFYKNTLKFIGNSFMPKQVRNMAGYILTGEIQTLPGKFLTLENIYLKNILTDKFIVLDNSICLPDVIKIEKTVDSSIHIFYVESNNKARFIKNIKEFRKLYKNIVIKII